MNEFTVVISDLVEDDPARNVESIKRAVISNLRASDAAVEIESTDYFNHTYAPDLVLRWDKGKEERQVYLRTSGNPEYLREDVAVISDRKPILMPLAPLRNPHQIAELGRESASASTLIADPASLYAFSAERQERPVLGLLSRAVLQGGRGLVDEDRARSTSDAVGLGFVAAQQAEVESTRDAVVAAESLLAPTHAGQLTRLLHAVWLGSGAPASSFPGATGVTAELDAVGLKLLLDIAVTEDDEFWQRIGAGITLERVCEIELGVHSQNLQRLIQSNLDHFKAKSLRISDVPVQTDFGADPRWFVHSGVLGYTTDRYRAIFSVGSVSSMDFMEEIENGSVELAELLDRASDAGLNISELVLESAAGGKIDYKAPPHSDISRDDLLQDLSSALGNRSSVLSVVVPLGGGSRQLACDLTKRAASGRTVAKFYLSEFLQSAVPILRSLRPSERNSIFDLVEVEELPPIRLRRRDDSAGEIE
ncbi:hypothetical protein JIX56_20010 [Streptomyces sp. CA-210063]|uniref:hypothetical protein n=1 Tax=Streptomyces sp. CA-210063 TaxID=2801029 RepID=UPI00214BAE2C|nr:hypothetical protein [Streptomyces sp. CA-210063]UUU32006.1 hypothetical protein JIX56_20010 [Streptomyces sp. CA-210063]